MNNEKLVVKANVEKPSFLKRTVAYLIDIIFVALLAAAVSMVFINNTKYQEKTEQLMDLTKKYSSGEITKEEYSEQFDTLNYYVTKEGVGTSIVNVGVALVYYVILCYFCHGITVGKYIMKLRIVSANEKKLNIGHYLIRALFVDLILSSVVSIIFVLTMNQSTFTSIYPKVSNVITIFLLVTMLFVMYRNDGRGLHDLMSNTKVISTKEVKVNVEVEDAKIVEEKQIEEKTGEKKKTTKKSNTKKTGGKK